MASIRHKPNVIDSLAAKTARAYAVKLEKEAQALERGEACTRAYLKAADAWEEAIYEKQAAKNKSYCQHRRDFCCKTAEIKRQDYQTVIGQNYV